jgi:8-oxo-dGTP pyrophosphatase MutT (NUDIX family)
MSPDPIDLAKVPVRPASTVMLVRDVDSGVGIEVFMLRRTLAAAFAGGMYVFPGGRVDDTDGTAEVEAVSDGLSDREASTRLGLSAGGLAYWTAAIRECFEEAGVLLARHATGDRPGDIVRFDDPSVAQRFELHRHAVHDGAFSIIDLCEQESLRLCAGDLSYVSHWITPVGEVRRFDTRFFVARAPQAQEPLHDDGETIASLWVSPGDALSRWRQGELAMIPPTLENLKFLADHTSADAVMAAAAAAPTPKPILPRLRVDAQGKVLGVVLPDEADYDSLG